MRVLKFNGANCLGICICAKILMRQTVLFYSITLFFFTDLYFYLISWYDIKIIYENSKHKMYLYILIQIDAFVVNENQRRNFPKCKRRIPEVYSCNGNITDFLKTCYWPYNLLRIFPACRYSTWLPLMTASGFSLEEY